MTGSLKDYDRPADRIRQHKRGNPGPVLVVEGPTDARVLKPHLQNVTMFPVNGKRNVLSVTAQLREWGTVGFIALTDRDFDDDKIYEPHEEFHIQYAGNDLEGMLVDLGVLADVIEELGSVLKLQTVGGGERIASKCVAEARRVANLRRTNHIEGWGIDFDSVDLCDKVNRADISLDIGSFCRSLRSQSKSEAIPSVSELVSIVDAPAVSEDYRGRDAIAIAGVALRKYAGTLSKAESSPALLDGMVRVSSRYRLSKSEWLGCLLNRLGAASPTN